MDERRHDGPISERVAILQTQMDRLVSDAESEKDTRKRASTAILTKFDAIEERLRAIDRRMWIWMGVVSAFVFIANFLFRGHP
jgi:hypothetical protein